MFQVINRLAQSGVKTALVCALSALFLTSLLGCDPSPPADEWRQALPTDEMARLGGVAGPAESATHVDCSTYWDQSVHCTVCEITNDDEGFCQIRTYCSDGYVDIFDCS